MERWAITDPAFLRRFIRPNTPGPGGEQLIELATKLECFALRLPDGAGEWTEDEVVEYMREKAVEER